MKQRERIINNYVKAYNNFDIDGMLIDLDQSIKFVNISSGEVNMTLNGLSAFKAQAIQAKDLFSIREQTIKSFKHPDDQSEIEIAYSAVLAIDLPNGLKRGDKLNINGKSTFKFSGDKIIEITDIS
ncbi:nuclear transport factor 2 family protein [Mucilaginibacter lappiensis]|uniref:nuclear transport factor 2 family protein n=1 Tax=Mucilaginibacter lappiensis TaxID=354630 RepID=UPI003D201BD8